MRVRHPRALDGDPPQIAVDVDGEHVPLDEDGTFEIPDRKRSWLESFASAYGVDPATLRVDEDDEGGEDGEDDAGDDETVADPPLDPAEYSVADLRDALDDADLDADDLEDIRELEKWGKNRTTALDAIDARLED